MNVAGRQFHRAFYGIIRVFQPVKFLEIGLQALEDLDGIRDRRLIDIDLLEAPHQGAVLFEILPIFLVGGRADAAQRARRQSWLQQVRGIHRTARCRPGTNHRMNFIDEENRLGMGFDFLHHLLEALLEITAIPRPREQRPHIQRINRGIGQHIRHVTIDDLPGKTFGNRGLADAGITHQKRVVLLTAAQHLDGAHHLGLAADKRINSPDARLLVQVNGIGRERAFLLLPTTFTVLARASLILRLLVLFIHTARAACFRSARALGNAMRDIVHRVIAGHLLLLQEIGGMAFALGEDRHQHIGPGHFLPARGLDMDDRALDDALEPCRRLGIRPVAHHQRLKLGIDIGGDGLAQGLQVNIAGPHHRGGILVVDQRQEEMLERREFMPPGRGKAKRLVEGIFEALRKTGQGLLAFLFRHRWVPHHRRRAAESSPGLVLFLFHHALQRMLVLTGEIHHLCHLGLGNLECIGTTFAHPVMVDMQHDLRGLFFILVEEPHQHVNDELHRGVIVVEQQNAIKVRPLAHRLGSRGQSGAMGRSLARAVT